MIAGNALVVGVARDCADNLPATLRRIEGFGSSFDKVDYLILTNDNSDGTVQVLQTWCGQMPRAVVKVLDGIGDNIPVRTARIAVVRNLYLAELRFRLETGLTYDYLVVIDMDGVNSELVPEPIFSHVIKNAPPDWVGLFANQRQKYYDIWALRHPEWSPDDCWAQVRKSTQKRGFKYGRKRRAQKAIERFVRARQRYIDPETGPIEVESAFGGFGIYRVQSLDGATYTGLHMGEPICEHVPFNEKIRASGGKLYILPGLLNDAPQEHL